MGIWESGRVKTTLEIDDELYREAKAHASLTGQKMKDLVTEGLRLALQPAARVTGPATAAASRELAACFAEADKLMKAAPHGPTAREHLNMGRKRLGNP
jgi:negative regulator of replication initiation